MNALFECKLNVIVLAKMWSVVTEDRLQALKIDFNCEILGGQLGAIRYSVVFAVVGTAADFTYLKLKDALRDYTKTIYQDIENSKNSGSWLKLPEWFPVQVLDEEALAAKRAQEEQFLQQRARIRSLKEEEP